MDGMEHDMIRSIQFSIFCYTQFGVYSMELDIFNKITK